MRNGLLATGWKFLHRPPARKSPFMTHVNAPLTPTGRLRMVLRHLIDGIPQAHVATEFRVSRPTVSTWVARYLQDGEEGLIDRPSTPIASPSRTPLEVVEHIEALWSAPVADLGPWQETLGPCPVHRSDRGGGLLRRPQEPLATRQQRASQRTAAPVPAQGHQPLPLGHPRDCRRGPRHQHQAPTHPDWRTPAEAFEEQVLSAPQHTVATTG